MSERRFLVAPGSLAEGEGALLILRGAEHHHLARVLRLVAGDAMAVFDGAGTGYRGTVERIDREETRVRLGSRDDRKVEPRLHVTLAQAIPRNPDRMDLLVQKTTEIGVSRIAPIVASRSVARPTGATGRLERWRRIAEDAARQSGRLSVPEVSEPATWEDFANRSGWSATERDTTSALPPQGELRLVLSTEDPRAEPLGGLGPDGPPRAVLAIGPEGGWSPQDLALAAAAGYRSIHLGPRVLRTETAGIVAVGLALFQAGDLR